MRYVGPRFDSAIPTGDQTLGSHHSADLTVNRYLGPSVDLSLAIDNLTDETFESAIGFPNLGRRLRLSVQGSLQLADR